MKKLKIIGGVIVAIAIVVGCGFLWHKKQMDSLREELNAEYEAKVQLQDAINDLANKYGIEIKEESGFQKAVTELKNKFFKYHQREEYVLEAEEISSKIADISELATVEYCYNNVGVFHYDGDSASIPVINVDFTVPWTGADVAITMDGKVKAGIDLSKVQIDCEEDKKQVIVTLPESEILSNELDQKSLKTEVDEHGIFNRLTPEQHSKMQQQIKDKGVKNAKKSGILQMANERAQQVIKDLVDSIQKGKGDYEVIFKTVEEDK